MKIRSRRRRMCRLKMSKISYCLRLWTGRSNRTIQARVASAFVDVDFASGSRVTDDTSAGIVRTITRTRPSVQAGQTGTHVRSYLAVDAGVWGGAGTGITPRCGGGIGAGSSVETRIAGAGYHDRNSAGWTRVSGRACAGVTARQRSGACAPIQARYAEAGIQLRGTSGPSIDRWAGARISSSRSRNASAVVETGIWRTRIAGCGAVDPRISAWTTTGILIDTVDACASGMEGSNRILKNKIRRSLPIETRIAGAFIDISAARRILKRKRLCIFPPLLRLPSLPCILQRKYTGMSRCSSSCMFLRSSMAERRTHPPLVARIRNHYSPWGTCIWRWLHHPRFGSCLHSDTDLDCKDLKQRWTSRYPRQVCEVVLPTGVDLQT